MATMVIKGVVSQQVIGKNSVYLTIQDWAGNMPLKVGVPVKLDDKDLQIPMNITLEGFSIAQGDRGLYFKAEKFHGEKPPIPK